MQEFPTRMSGRNNHTTNQLVDNFDDRGYCCRGRIRKVRSGRMHAILIWAHVGLMMGAFGASPLGRLGLRYLLSGISEPQSAQTILRGFSNIFLAGGILVTAGVCVGLALAWDAGLTQKWVATSIALIVLAGIGGVAIEDRWVKRLRRAEGDAFAAILHEKVPLWAALASPVIWLCVLWLMIEKPA